MAPAEGELDRAPPGQNLVGLVAVHLQHTLEPGQMRRGTLGRAIGRVDVGHPGRIGPTPGSIIPGIRPELARLGAAPAWIEHGGGGLVRKQLGRSLQFVEQALVHRAQVEGGPPDPVGQGGAVEPETLTGVDLGLPVERKMVGVFGTSTWATVPSVGSPPWISRAGAGACTTPSSQARQAYFGRGSPAPGPGPAQCRGARTRPRRSDAAVPRSTGTPCSRHPQGSQSAASGPAALLG